MSRPILISEKDIAVMSDEEILQKIESLEKRVFIYASSKADKDFFKRSLYSWLRKDDDTRPLNKVCEDMIWQRNDKGRTIKYLYFNDYSQKIYLDHTFLSWTRLVVASMMREADKKGVSI